MFFLDDIEKGSKLTWGVRFAIFQDNIWSVCIYPLILQTKAMFGCWKTKKGKIYGLRVQFSGIFQTFIWEFWHITMVLKNWSFTWNPHIFSSQFHSKQTEWSVEKLMGPTYQSQKNPAFAHFQGKQTTPRRKLHERYRLRAKIPKIFSSLED